MVDAQQGEGLDELGLGGGGADSHQRLAGEYRRPLRHGPHIPGEAECTQVVQKILLEQVFAAQIGDVFPVKVEIPDILHQLLQAGGNGEAAPIGHPAEEHVKIGDALPHPLTEIAVGHGHLVEVKQHGQVQSLLMFHKQRSSVSFVMSGHRKAPPLYSITFFRDLQRSRQRSWKELCPVPAARRRQRGPPGKKAAVFCREFDYRIDNSSRIL